jgi:hypothetical protein
MLDNELLAKLNEDDRQRLAPHMMIFELNRKGTLPPAGENVVDTWFPCGSSLASFQLDSEDGAGAVEVALIGREGASAASSRTEVCRLMRTPSCASEGHSFD